MFGVDIFIRGAHGGTDEAPNHQADDEEGETFRNPVLDPGC